MVDHRLAATRRTVRCGYFDAALAPVIEIDSGSVSRDTQVLPPAIVSLGLFEPAV